jgi:predicted HicB family RNase H-like nuclease
MPPVSKEHQEYTAKYVKENYDEFKVRTPKGKKTQVQKHSVNTGESMNAFINRAIDEAMERDKQAQQSTN